MAVATTVVAAAAAVMATSAGVSLKARVHRPRPVDGVLWGGGRATVAPTLITAGTYELAKPAHCRRVDGNVCPRALVLSHVVSAAADGAIDGWRRPKAAVDGTPCTGTAAS